LGEKKFLWREALGTFPTFSTGEETVFNLNGIWCFLKFGGFLEKRERILGEIYFWGGEKRTGPLFTFLLLKKTSFF